MNHTMVHKVEVKKPFILILYGYPGSGKSVFARSFASEIDNTIHINSDKIEAELGQDIKSEKVVGYMAKEFLGSGFNIVLDIDMSKRSQRKKARLLAGQTGAKLIMVWLQIDAESAFARLANRDKRRTEDKYAKNYSRSDFETIINTSHNPDQEDYVVISGKHTFKTQKAAVFKKLEDLGVLSPAQTLHRKIKPELVNLIPQFRDKDGLRRRDISIR
ncbi:MAG TPA: ATP-binding protein [Patescibacteria group bacterium]|nr:ATP-binding protein [Patescibacteria group bacterium]